MVRTLVWVLALAAVFVTTPAQAILYTVNFTVNAGFAGSGSGSFSFDGSIILPGGTVGSLLGTDDFSSDSNVTLTHPTIPAFGTQTWSSVNSGVGYLVFDSSGNLTEWQMGGNPEGIGSDPALSPLLDFRIQSLSSEETASTKWSPAADASNVSGPLASNIVVWSITSSGSASEPGSLALLGFGLAGILATGRRVTRRL